MVKILVIVIQERNINFLQIANLAPSFSGNDVICVEGTEQIIHARFCYGPMDLVALSRENISAYIRPTGGDWQLVKTDVTDSHGKITFEVYLSTVFNSYTTFFSSRT